MFINNILTVINSVSGVIGKIYLYRNVYRVTGVFATRRFPKALHNHKYAVLVAARNEEAVIGHLVESIRSQDYPAELVDIFVVADNCTDRTAEVARAKGAVCYERHDEAHRTKGFALQYLMNCIKKDYGIESFEGYFLFDADNLLKPDYISHMNDSFDAGEKIITSFRNTKNFGENWISASYGLHWLRTIRNEHRARSLFRLATRIQGTGFLFASEVVKDGWNYTSLTEDRAFCADAVVNGYKISYNNQAEFFDEQPVDIKTAMRQRIRWSKGHLQAFAESGGKLFAHIFRTDGKGNIDTPENAGTFKRFLLNLKFRFMSLDILTVVYPRAIFTFFKRLINLILRSVLVFTAGFTVTASYCPKMFRSIFKFLLTGKSPTAAQAVLLLTLFTLLLTVSSYIKSIFTAVYLFVFERKRILPMPIGKKIFYCLTFPIFDIMGKISFIIALFTKVEWKPIPHNDAVGIDDLYKSKKQ